MTAQRIVSLLPSATEIVYALDLGDRLYAVTHECDFPPEATEKPHVTRSVIESDGLSAAQIDAAVRSSLAEGATIYYLDDTLLADVQPDLILTQELCDVCAVGPDLVKAAARSLPRVPQIVSLEPTTLDGVLESIETVGALAGVEERARTLVATLRFRLQRVADAVATQPIRRVLTLEWVDPLFTGGHWVPQMVSLAGGQDVLGVAGQPSRQHAWHEALSSDPDVIVAMPCGFGVERSMRELAASNLPDGWHELRAVRSGQVYAVDGSSYFNRPGPRLVDGVEIMASILHPGVWQWRPAGSVRRVSFPSPTAIG